MLTNKVKTMETMNAAPRPVAGSLRTLVLILIVLVVAAAGMAYYFYSQAAELRKNPQLVAQEEIENVVSRVSELMVLPANEVPTVGVVADPAQLKDQPFFAQAKTGDKVLIYTNAGRAILYDPVAHKIVNVAPINIGGATAEER